MIAAKNQVALTAAGISGNTSVEDITAREWLAEPSPATRIARAEARSASGASA
jgi:hypothetical protein